MSQVVGSKISASCWLHPPQPVCAWIIASLPYVACGMCRLSMKFIAYLCYCWGGSTKKCCDKGCRCSFFVRLPQIVLKFGCGYTFYMHPKSSGQISWLLNLCIPWCWVAYLPLSRRECSPIMYGSIASSWSFRALDYVLTSWKIYPLVTAVQKSLWYDSQRRLSSVSPLLRMWWTLRDRDYTTTLVPVDYRCNVSPMHPFL